MKIKFKYILLSISICLMVLSGRSQEVTETEEITVVAPYQPSVSDAFKINVSPRIPEEKLDKPNFSYDIVPKTIQSPVSLEPIKPAKIMGESVPKLYRNYAKVGLGNYWTPLFEFYANKLRSKKNAFGVYVKHLSSSGTIKDYAFPGNSNTAVSAYGKKFIKNQTLSLEVDYNRTGAHFYGFSQKEFEELGLSKKDIKQSYNRFGFNAGIESNHTRGKKVNNQTNLGYYYLFDRYDATEHNIKFDERLNKQFEFFEFSEIEKLGLDLGLDYYINKDTLTNHNSGLIRIDPYYNLVFDQYSFKIGVRADIEMDSSSKVHVYPIVAIEVKVVKEYLRTYAGIYGEMNKNSLKSFSDENPFIISTIEKRFSNNKLSQFGGIRGRLTKYLDYNLSFVNSTIENMPFFVNDTISAMGKGLNNQFTVVYDKVKYSRVIAEFGFHYKNKFNAMLRGKYNSYFLDNEDKAWHKPALEISLSADYSMQDKILLKAELITRSKMYAKDYELNASNEMIVKAIEIDPMVDLNLGVEYRYSKVLSGFITFNNILGQRYYRWYNYPSYRFNMMLGITYSF
ncbi:MAG: hypothetical protein K8R74_12460 [Bacteroidales bacterium]|nr:hypothetical protein [Bacteroidales bacterium]